MKLNVVKNMGISVVVLTKNSEKTIEATLKSLTWCNEIVVIDDNSTDATETIAKKYEANFFTHDLNNDFSKQRNFGLEKTKNDWVLFIDSDEIVNLALQQEVCKYANMQICKYDGFFIKRVDTMWERTLLHGEVGNIWLLRLAKKNAGTWQGSVHEVWRIKGKTRKLQNSLDHFPHPTMSEFLAKVNFYSTLRAEELSTQGIRVSFLNIIVYPKAKFFVNYFLKLGMLDGIPGFLVAVLMSFHSFLVRGKLWQLQNTHQ